MTTLKVEIDKEQDLQVLQVLLIRLGLKYNIEDNEWAGLSVAEVEGIKAGLKDREAGRVYSHSDVRERLNKKLTILRTNNG
jgi:hypothetical protein